MVSIRFDSNANVDTHNIVKVSKPSASLRAISSMVLLWCCLGYAAMTRQVAESFQTTTTQTRQLPCDGMARNNNNSPPHVKRGVLGRQDPLHLFGKNKNGDAATNKNSSIKDSETGEREKKRSKIPFFGRLSRSKDGAKDEPQKQEEPIAVATTTAELRPLKSKKKDPINADDLKLMAERARLEAERLDAELTLSKIEKLEQKLLKSKKESEDGSDSNTAVVEDLQHQLDVLQTKLKGEPVPIKKTATTQASTEPTTTTSVVEAEQPVIRVAVEKKEVEVLRTGVIDEIDNAKFLEVAEILSTKQPEIFTFVTKGDTDIDSAPEMLVMMVAPFYGIKAEPGQKIDRQEIKRRAQSLDKLDYSFLDGENIEPPTFVKSDIRQRKLDILNREDEIRGSSQVGLDRNLACMTKSMIEKADGNATKLAIYSLEYDYYVYGSIDNVLDDMVDSALDQVLDFNSTGFDLMYPNCISNRGENKGDDYVSEEPTEAQIDVLTKTILPAIKFSTSEKPEKVGGGYLIKGSHKFEDGDALIEAIDSEIAKSRPNLKDQVTVLYTPSYGSANVEITNLQSLKDFDSMDMSMFEEQDPILFVTYPNPVRDVNSYGLALTSILGLATSWYLSVYPFLLNDKIASRIDADLQLVEANLQPDLSYLTDLSIPLFLCFLGIQLVHESAHRVTAMSKGVKLSVPVFVPSFITGVTSTVTTFKTLPKNKNDMFDISASGPLAGIVVSSMALALGAKLTLISDPATLPALPLDILRQSTLGGAIIDKIITGSLYVPEGAPTAGITIPLHPFGIAGYVGLIVNALALLPIGSKSF